MNTANVAAPAGRAGCKAIIDTSQIDGLVEAAGPEGAAEILAAFWRSTDELLARLARQLKEQDVEEASRTAHALKGSALNVGAAKFSDLARAIEEGCRAGDPDKALALLDQTDALRTETKAAFARRLDR
ncbi:Hpt domain-containing protein [Amphiplicatus metriothermophilus]|uniref:HPt (Histidine-containing phosphotransfer) domain-containing protein n=1 Tax=Amphiplicatus metriothermophilus TaxID=1519374 RepID=A0A239PRW8_9PROT|nr:Hpt domain-containing protein [Amphiplicatus metriothermophilus]MBB5518376.1 HPt (histidine-containing phosphotransfer) domain-containing protein [Amphiplicatus metriothermophilus]SNT72457.1 HPt (histidine-containing phosphotransfer) domain-containing protein [Amphiplicatus metriothermophilus]